MNWNHRSSKALRHPVPFPGQHEQVGFFCDQPGGLLLEQLHQRPGDAALDLAQARILPEQVQPGEQPGVFLARAAQAAVDVAQQEIVRDLLAQVQLVAVELVGDAVEVVGHVLGRRRPLNGFSTALVRFRPGTPLPRRRPAPG